MDFEKIKYFLTLAETLNYTKASQILYISQPMLSRSIKSIEKEIGAALFSRNTREVALTHVGQCMADGLREINAEYNFLLEQIRATNNGSKGSILIGVLVGAVLGNTAEMIALYKLNHPDIRVEFTTIDSPEELFQAIIKNKIDFGLGVGIPKIKQKLSYIDLCQNELRIVMSTRNSLASIEGPLSIQDLKAQTFITPADSISTAYKELIARCSVAGFSPEIITVPDIMAVALTVELNQGVAFFHKHSAFLGCPNLVFKRINASHSSGSFSLYWDPASKDQKLLSFIQYVENSIHSINDSDECQ